MWWVLALGWGLVGLSGLVWVAAWASAALAGGHVPAFGGSWVAALVRGRTTSTWPGTPSILVACLTLLLTGTAAGVVMSTWHWVSGWLPHQSDPVAALRHNPGVLPLTPEPSARTAVRLRASLATTGPRKLTPADTGLILGNLMRPGMRGPALYASWEDTVVAFMAPRSGKTTALGVPYVLSAPGPVVATSIKADLWAATARLRATRGCRVWLFDPQHITCQHQEWWWDPLHGLASVEAAHRMSSHFVLTVADGRQRDLWGPAAQELLCALFLAAAVSGRSLRDVARWLDDTASPTPAELLDTAGFRALGSSLRGAQNGAPETRDGIYQTARTAAACLHDEEIMRWVAPPSSPLPVFRPDGFAASRDTLYLLTESRASASPLIAALTDTVMRAGRRLAETEGGRLDPPMVLILDEAANICRIGDLPDLYSHLGSRGMVPVTILQSYQQGVTVWGEAGMASLWGAATRKVIGAGIDDPRLARDLAVLIGQHDVPVRSASYGDGRASEQISLRRQDIMQAADIRALLPGTALLLATGARPALIKLRPWYTGPDAALVADATRQAEHAMREGARRMAASRDTPGAQAAPRHWMSAADDIAMAAMGERNGWHG
ncbi:MAG TPA: TraM recognition domain-containing protein [Streptosporangiaceae bacterium]|nr:TraM recognition domain-containing protein [Streptosporangiaceae bacterium]